jgi:hypothetical protein
MDRMVCQQCDELSAELRLREREHLLVLDCFRAVDESEDAAVFHKIRTKLSDARMEHELARLVLEKHLSLIV